MLRTLKNILSAKGIEHRFYIPAQLLGWLLMACIWYSLHGFYRADADELANLYVWNVMMYSECLALTHFVLRPLYWWLSETGWRHLAKIATYFLAIHICVWGLLGADKIFFSVVSGPIQNFDWIEPNIVILYHLAVVTWALIYHYWNSKKYQQETTPRENPAYYMACQVLGWAMVCGLWYVLYTGRGVHVENDMGVFWPWVSMVCVSGMLLSHLILRPSYRRLINLVASLPLKIFYSAVIIYICTIWAALISMVWFSWSGVQLVERTEGENYAGVIISFAIFCIWSLLYTGWLNWKQKIDETTRRLKLEASYQAAQISGLKQQLNPHFIFNALNSLRVMIVKDQYVARKMVTEISNMLRYSLYESDKDVVPLSQEIEIVKNYLAIELLRYEIRISVTWDVPDELLQTSVIPLCIQTLVENAIKHTINQYSDGIFIRIRVESQGSAIRISIQNRGKIVPSEREGIGLKNTQERLALIFGDGASLTLVQKESELVEALIRIPNDVHINPSDSEKSV